MYRNLSQIGVISHPNGVGNGVETHVLAERRVHGFLIWRLRGCLKVIKCLNHIGKYGSYITFR